MPYTAEISRSNPSCFVFLIDQSGSKQDPFGGGESTRKKADGVADAINKLLQNLVIKCAKSEGVRDYYNVSVIGYGTHVGSAFAGALSGRESVPISEIANQPAHIEERTKKIDDASEQQLSNDVNDLKSRYANERKPLEAEQATARKKTEEVLQEITNRYASESRALSDRRVRVSLESSEQCRRINDEINKTRKQMSEHQWQLAKLERDLTTFKNVSLKTYFRILVGMQRF